MAQATWLPAEKSVEFEFVPVSEAQIRAWEVASAEVVSSSVLDLSSPSVLETYWLLGALPQKVLWRSYLIYENGELGLVMP